MGLRLMRILAMCILNLTGFMGVDGYIRIYVGDRVLSRLALVGLMVDTFERLLFGNLPGVPAENRWLVLGPMLAWTACFAGLLGVGPLAWLLAFASVKTYPD